VGGVSDAFSETLTDSWFGRRPGHGGARFEGDEPSLLNELLSSDETFMHELIVLFVDKRDSRPFLLTSR
jgi:hypothetical protein